MKRLQIFLAGTAFVMASGAAAQLAPQGMTSGQDYEANTQAPAKGTTPVDPMNDAPSTADPALAQRVQVAAWELQKSSG